MSTENFPNDPDLSEFADLVVALEESRPVPDPGFTDSLDIAVADHFPPDWSDDVTSETTPGFGDRFNRWLAGLRAHLLPVTAGFAGLLLVCVAVGVGLNGNGGSGDTNFDSTVAQKQRSESANDSGAGSTAAPEAVSPDSGGASATYDAEAAPSAGSSSTLIAPDEGARTTGPLAAGVDNRKVAQEAEITLGTKPEDVQDVSNDIVVVVDDHNGIVLDSSVQDGPAGEAGASFSLVIPSSQLEDAISDLSGIADLKSRSQESEDITAPTLTIEDKLETARARVKSLVKELSESTTDEDRASIENELDIARFRVSNLTTKLNKLERKANFTPVAVNVVTDQSTDSDEGDSAWGIGDAVDDAGHMLGIAAGVALIALEIAIPIAIMVLIALAVNRAWVRHSRRRALEEN